MARYRMYRLYRYAYEHGFTYSVCRSLYVWFLWNVYDKVRFNLRTKMK